MLRTFDALIATPMRGMRGSFLPRSYRSIHQPRGVFSTVLLKSVAVCFYALGADSPNNRNATVTPRGGRETFIIDRVYVGEISGFRHVVFKSISA